MLRIIKYIEQFYIIQIIGILVNYSYILYFKDTPESTPMAEEETYYGLPWWRQLIWSVLFVTMATTATCGNLIVIWIVLWHQRMRTVTNYFIGTYNYLTTTCSSNLVQ